MKTMREQLGLSLVELMISIALGLVLMTGVVQMFLSSKVVFSTQQGLSRIQETGRLAVDFIARDVRQAAYYGCYRPAIRGTPDLELRNGDMQIGGLHGDFDIGIMGYDSPAALPNVAIDLGAAIAPIDNTSILVIRSASQTGSLITAPTTPTTIQAFTNQAVDGAGCVGNLCPGAALVASDCTQGRIFTPTALAVAGNTLTITHADLWTAPAGDFTRGQVMPINTTVYFLATGAGGGPSLWQRINNGVAVELLEGVENMRITYATYSPLAGPTPGVLDGNGYVSAAAITALGAVNGWPGVGAVHVELVMRSLEDNVASEVQPYTFAGAVVTPTDRRIRQVFSSVTAIRSRMITN